VRAVDFLCSRKDVSQKHIAVWGGSQGGGLSWMTAALDPRVDLCVADIPWLADWVSYFRLTDWLEVNEWIAARPERSWKSTLETLSYFDTMNVAARIRCPVLMSVGLQDRICPPSTSFATFNRIAGPKEYVVYPRARHRLPRKHYDLAERWIRRKLGVE
jgi:cephalosporin-C deacetylase